MKLSPDFNPTEFGVVIRCAASVVRTVHRGRRLLGRVACFLVAASLAGSVAWSATASFTLIRTASTSSWVKFSSPVLVDLDGNPQTLEIVVGDESGNIYGFDSQANLMWTFSIRNYPGLSWVQTACQSSPAVADMDGDGAKEVAVTLASRDEYAASKPGAIFLFHLDATGRNPTFTGGFARLALDRNLDSIADGCFASPTVADLNGDGKLEVLAGSWDELLYAIKTDGGLVWNLNYDPTDPNEYGFKAGDTIWTTPAVADIDGNGTCEVVFGADAHLANPSVQIPFQSKAGGVLVVLDAPTGHLQFGPAPSGGGKFFIESYAAEGGNPYGENHIPVCNLSEVLQSSPVIADVDADGRYEIIHGTGQNVHWPTSGWHNGVYCWNGENATLKWATNVGAEVFACCAVANVDGDPDLEVFVRNFSETNPKLYGLKGSTGAVLPGFPVAIQPGNPRSIGAVIGDVEGDGQMEIILISYGRVHVFGANGVQESYFDGAPAAMFTSPAIGDIDHCGQCEMVVGTANGIAIYRCSGTVGTIPWGQYRRDALKSGVVPRFTPGPANLTLTGMNASPTAPTQLQPGGSLVLGTYVENTGGTASGPFWLEFWGSRTGGLTLDLFLADSVGVGSLTPGGGYSFAQTKPLYSIPDGPYTVVFVADRPNQVAESNERDNHGVVAGKRLLVLRPQTNADLVIEGFTFGPNPVHNGQTLSLGGQVRNAGTQNSGLFWIEFWGSFDRTYPQLDFFLCDSIGVSNLAPGGTINLSSYARTLYGCPAGTFMAGVFIDRLDQVNERDETNNHAFVNNVNFNLPPPVEKATEPVGPLGGPDIVILSADFSPAAPTQATPGQTLTLQAQVKNQGTTACGAFWVEFWGSKLGGLSLDQFVADSVPVAGIPAGNTVNLNLTRSLYSIPDGPYTITVVADRPNAVAEDSESNNRKVVAQKRLLTIRPATQANLVIEAFGVGSSPLHLGQSIPLTGKVKNIGTQNSGLFWIEFWGSLDQDYPNLGFFLCDSIGVTNLAPGAMVDLSAYTRNLYASLPTVTCAVLCFADRTDLVNETNEADNYVALRGCQIAP